MDIGVLVPSPKRSREAMMQMLESAHNLSISLKLTVIVKNRADRSLEVI